MRSFPVSLLVLTLGVGGCSGTTEAPAITDDASAKPDGGGPVEPPATKHGFVSVLSMYANLWSSAVFLDEPRAEAVEGCVVGAFKFPMPDDPPPTPSRPVVKAGDVSVSLVTKSQGRVQNTLPWDPAQESYFFSSWPGPEKPESAKDFDRLDVAGESVDIKVTGDVVPAFEASVVAAANFEVIGTEPAKDPRSAPLLRVAKSGDLALAWSNAKNPSMSFTLQGWTKYLLCRFPAGATSGVVPAALLEQVVSEAMEEPDCPGATCLDAHLDGQQVTHVRAGDFDVSVSHSRVELLRLVFQP